MPEWSLYLVRCKSGTLYTGISNDVGRRFAEHQTGGAKTAKYLRGRGPLALVYSYPAGDRSMASKLEARVKKLPKTLKEELVKGVFNIEDIETPI